VSRSKEKTSTNKIKNGTFNNNHNNNNCGGGGGSSSKVNLSLCSTN
jgi:hypothetical protein